MSGAPLRLRVAVAAADPVAADRLRMLVGRSGHDLAAAGEAADVVLTDGSAGWAGAPTVALGAAAGGFAGRLPASAGPVQLDAALRAVAAGLVVRPPDPGPRFGPLPEALPQPLTPREVEVLTALGEGLSNKEAARRLGVSPHTVKFHIEQLFRKLDAASRAEAVAKGLRRQLVEL